MGQLTARITYIFMDVEGGQQHYENIYVTLILEGCFFTGPQRGNTFKFPTFPKWEAKNLQTACYGESVNSRWPPSNDPEKS